MGPKNESRFVFLIWMKFCGDAPISRIQEPGGLLGVYQRDKQSEIVVNVD
jgi:hypothetical protein